MVATEENKNILKMNKAAVQLFLNEYLIWLAIDGVVSNVKSWNHYDVLKTKMNNLLVRSGQRSYDAAEENKSNYVFKKWTNSCPDICEWTFDMASNERSFIASKTNVVIVNNTV